MDGIFSLHDVGHTLAAYMGDDRIFLRLGSINRRLRDRWHADVLEVRELYEAWIEWQREDLLTAHILALEAQAWDAVCWNFQCNCFSCRYGWESDSE